MSFYQGSNETCGVTHEGKSRNVGTDVLIPRRDMLRDIYFLEWGPSIAKINDYA